MKNILLIFLLCPALCFGQGTQPNKNKKNNIKIGFAGALILAGSVTTIARVSAKVPQPGFYTSQTAYATAVNKYEQNQKGLTVVSSVLYGLGGISLITVKFDF